MPAAVEKRERLRGERGGEEKREGKREGDSAGFHRIERVQHDALPPAGDALSRLKILTIVVINLADADLQTGRLNLELGRDTIRLRVDPDHRVLTRALSAQAKLRVRELRRQIGEGDAAKLRLEVVVINEIVTAENQQRVVVAFCDLEIPEMQIVDPLQLLFHR